MRTMMQGFFSFFKEVADYLASIFKIDRTFKNGPEGESTVKEEFERFFLYLQVV